jgi:hypothetical protein
MKVGDYLPLLVNGITSGMLVLSVVYGDSWEE